VIVVDALRLSFGTFTGIKVREPKRVDARVIKIALFLSFLPALVVSGAAWLAGYLAFRFTHAPLVASVIVIGAEILLTAGLHIDGLLDTADGVAVLAKGGRDRALEVMRVGNSGPAAFATGLLALLLQAAVLSTAFARHLSVSWIICAIVARFAVVSSCRTGAKPARPDGLGNPFIGSVDFLWLALSAATNLAIVEVLGVGRRSWLLLATVVVAIVFGELLKRRAEEQFGGLTGDVLGSILEKVRTLSLLMLTLNM
jgi:adenosylcobinamide-GDP ribazoletransferase